MFVVNITVMTVFTFLLLAASVHGVCFNVITLLTDRFTVKMLISQVLTSLHSENLISDFRTPLKHLLLEDKMFVGTRRWERNVKNITIIYSWPCRLVQRFNTLVKRRGKFQASLAGRRNLSGIYGVSIKTFQKNFT